MPPGSSQPGAPVPAALFIHHDILITSQRTTLPRQLVTALWGAAERSRSTMTATTWPPDQRCSMRDGTPIPVGARVGRTGVDLQLGAPRRSATRLVVRFGGRMG